MNTYTYTYTQKHKNIYIETDVPLLDNYTIPCTYVFKLHVFTEYISIHTHIYIYNPKTYI